MIEQLTGPKRLLAEYMSYLSEEAYTAGWIEGLEYALWNAVLNGPTSYGRLDISEKHIEKLIELSDVADGWIYFDDSLEEIFLSRMDWERMYSDNIGKYSGRIT